jgi:hypothetical protein
MHCIDLGWACADTSTQRMILPSSFEIDHGNGVMEPRDKSCNVERDDCESSFSLRGVNAAVKV